MKHLLVKNNNGGYDYTKDFENSYSVAKKEIELMYNKVLEYYISNIGINELQAIILEASHGELLKLITPTIYTDDFVKYLSKTLSKEEIDKLKKVEDECNKSLISCDMNNLYKKLFKLGYTPDQIFFIVELASREVFIDKTIFN